MDMECKRMIEWITYHNPSRKVNVRVSNDDNNKMEQIRKKFPYFFLLIISLIIFFVAFSIIKLLVLDLQPFTSTGTAIFLVVYSIVFLLLAWSIVQSIRRDPGKVPLQWGFTLTSESKKYCLICHVFKPQRTHHCSVCGRCVLNMDHHCPWINSCIGFHNRKPFILMLFYTILATLIGAIACVAASKTYFEAFSSGKSGIIVESLVIGIAFLLNIVILFAIASFFKFHIGLILNNQTTIETLELSRQGKDPATTQSPYNIGKYYNWVQVFGTNSWTWFIPVFLSNEGPAGDGVIWPKKPASSAGSSH